MPDNMTANDIKIAEAARTALADAVAARSEAFNGITPATIAKPAPKGGLEAVAARLAEPAKLADNLATDARRAEAQDHVGDLLTRAHAATSRHGVLRSKHLDRAQRVAALPYDEIRRALPHDWEIGAGVSVSPSRVVLGRLEQVSKELVGALTSTFGDSHRDAKDIDPISLDDAATQVDNALASGRAHDSASGRLGQEFRRLVNHLRVWVERGERLVASAESLAGTFERVAKDAETILAAVTPGAAVASEPKRAIPAVEKRKPAASKSSLVADYDPRG